MKKIRVPVPRHPGIWKIKMQDEKGKLHDPDRGFQFLARYSVLENGKRVKRSISCVDLNEARAVRANNGPLKHMLETVVDAASDSEMSFLKLRNLYEKNSLSHQSRSTQNNFVGRVRHLSFFDKFKVKDIKPATILAWLAFIKKPDYVATQKSTRFEYRHEWLLLRAILSYYQTFHQEDYSLPFRAAHRKLLKIPGRERKVEQKDMSLAEFKAFSAALKAMDEPGQHVFYYLAMMQYATYSRIQEAAALRFEDFSKKQVKIQRRIEWPRRVGQELKIVAGTKKHPGKIIPSNDFIEHILREWKLKSGKRMGFLFEQKDKPLQYRAIQVAYDRAFQKAGIQFKGTHLLRHASLTEAYHLFKDIKATASLAGHSSVHSTQRYAKTRSEHAEQQQEKMSENMMGVLKI